MQAVLWLLAAMLAFQQNSSKTAPAQPLPYSHKTHLAAGLKCRDCHTNPDPGDRMEFPGTAKCMICHTTIAKDKPTIQKLAEFEKSNQQIPWVRVYVLSAGVYWNHRSHLEAGMKCETCHGPVAQMDVTANVTNVTTMAGCVDCHQQMKAGTGCEFCHEGK
jgi:Cytochrome c7 and related cytochrome c/Cytochrome c3